MLAALLAAFGLYDLSDQQEEALSLAVGWAAALVLGDAGLRAGRSLAAARVETAEVVTTGPGVPTGSTYTATSAALDDPPRV